jgi:hypothetical protein
VPVRFIPVRSDDSRILTCVLEEQGDEFVAVHDLLHERRETGWAMSVSSYRKVRLSAEGVRADCAAADLEVASIGLERGLVTLVGRRLR